MHCVDDAKGHCLDDAITHFADDAKTQCAINNAHFADIAKPARMKQNCPAALSLRFCS